MTADVANSHGRISLDRGLVQQIARPRHNRLPLTHSLERGIVQQLSGGITKSHTRALAGMESSSTLEGMKAIDSLNQLVPKEAPGDSTNPTSSRHWHIRRRDSLPLREAIPLWFAISSPLIGLIIGFLGAWFVTWLTS
jgi:hypothetical protein